MPIESPLTLTVDGVSTSLTVLHFDGHEGISELFEFEILVATDSPLVFADVVRKTALLSIETDPASAARYVHGIVSRIEETDPGKTWLYYSLTLVPKPWRLLHRTDNRIFQDLTAPLIVQKVLEGAGLATGDDFRLSLQLTYASREYCVQYRESDWEFVCRLLEEEGIYFYFEHTDSKHVLVLGDALSTYPAIGGPSPLVFRPPTGALGAPGVAGTRVSTYQMSQNIRSGKSTLRDWNFTKPSLSLEQSKTATLDTDLPMYDYPGEYVEPAPGGVLAQLRLDEQSVGRATGGGRSDCPWLLGGATFTLSEHPREAYNATYLVTRVTHTGSSAEAEAAADEEERKPVYQNQFEVVPSTVLYRPPRVTRRPHIHGVQTATVVGPSGEEIYTDQYGRVKVQFHWDRLGQSDDKSSCWILVAQPWASQSYGAMFIPRVQDEVVVTFLEGDPDRPLIVGSIYHGTNVVPYALPGNKTRSTIKSNTSPGGNGSNELRFEDKKGSEEVYLHAQKDWTIKTENDKNQLTGHNETLEVTNDRTKKVDHDQMATIGHDDTFEVKNDQTGTVDHDQTLTVKHDRSTTVQNDHTESVTGNQSITISKAQTVVISDKQQITVSKTRSLTVNDDVTETFAAKLTLAVTGDVSETLSANRTVAVSGDHKETISGKAAITVSGDSTESVTGKKTFTVNDNVTITAGSSTVTIKPSGEITIQGVQVTINGSGPVKIQGATIDVESQGPATFKAPVISSSADGNHTVKGAVVTLDGQMINVG